METEEYVKVAGYVFLYDLEEDLQVVTAIRLKDGLPRLVLSPWDSADPEEVFFGWTDDLNACYISISSFGDVIILDTFLVSVKDRLMSVPGKLVVMKDKTYKNRNMMKVIVYLVLLIVFFLYLGHTEISFSPFRIKIIEWYKPLGIIIMTVGFFIYTVGNERESFKDGWTKAKNEIINKITDESR